MPDVVRSKAGGARGQRSATEIVAPPEFKHLVARRWKVSMGLLIALFVIYYGYILLIPYAPALLTSRVGEVTTLGIPLAIGVIVAAFVLTAAYVAWANSSYDPEVSRLKGQLRS